MRNSLILFIFIIACSCNIYNNKQLDSSYVATRISNARKYYMDQQYRLGIDELNKLITNRYFLKEYITERPKVLYNQACLYALVGEKEKALDCLEQSVGYGFASLNYIEKDNDLYIIRKSDRYLNMVENLRKENELWNGKYINTPFQSNISTQEKVAGLSKLWYEIKYNYIAYNNLEFNLDSIYFEYLNKVADTRTTKDYYLQLKHFCDYLNDRGTNVIFPEEIQDATKEIPPVQVQVVNNKVVISNILGNNKNENNEGTKDNKLQKNNIILTEFASENDDSFYKTLKARTEKYRIFEDILMDDHQNNSIELDVNNAGEDSISYSIAKIEQPLKAPPVLYKRLENNIGYLAINTFTPALSRTKFDSIFNQIVRNDALIIDLRNNCESKGNIGWYIFRLLTNESLKHPLWEARAYNAGFRAWGTNDMLHEFFPPLDRPILKESFLKPVVLLTQSNTCGVAEDFCAAFKILKRGMIIGSPTSGSGGNPLTISLPGGGYAKISTSKIIFPNGESNLGKGVQPDIFVKQNKQDFRNNYDAVLNTAIFVLREQIEDCKFILNPNERRYTLS